MKQQFPLDSSRPFQEYTIQLEGISYRFRFYWSTRNVNWYISIGTLDRWILVGERLIPDAILFKNVQDPDMPKGVFSTSDLSLRRQDPLRGDLGNSFVLQYLPSDDFYTAQNVALGT